jgi:hypothetical protein
MEASVALLVTALLVGIRSAAQAIAFTLPLAGSSRSVVIGYDLMLWINLLCSLPLYIAYSAHLGVWDSTIVGFLLAEFLYSYILTQLFLYVKNRSWTR